MRWGFCALANTRVERRFKDLARDFLQMIGAKIHGELLRIPSYLIVIRGLLRSVIQ
jgi:hypothetical protein